MNQFLFTSESVSDGHPDKICDQISDALVDDVLANNSEGRCAIETAATTNRVIVFGEYRGDLPSEKADQIIRDVVKDIGYEQDGFHHQNLVVENYLHEQSADIAQGVDESSSKEEGAGDQGLMFGYACDETDALMPAAIYYSHEILKNLRNARKGMHLGKLLPDAKTQLTLQYKDGAPVSAHKIVLSTQHHPDLSQADVRNLVIPIIKESLPKGWVHADTEFFINPTGRFVIGGPDGDAGLTGRKIIVDTYGGAAPHGGGAFSGKDPTKVDRSAAYMARYLAKNIVANKLSKKCTIQLAYSIGVAKPMSVYVDLHQTDAKAEQDILEKILTDYDLTPKGIRTHLGLNRPIYKPSASYGHFGRKFDGEFFPWEQTEKW